MGNLGVQVSMIQIVQQQGQKNTKLYKNWKQRIRFFTIFVHFCTTYRIPLIKYISALSFKVGTIVLLQILKWKKIPYLLLLVFRYSKEAKVFEKTLTLYYEEFSSKRPSGLHNSVKG